MLFHVNQKVTFGPLLGLIYKVFICHNQIKEEILIKKINSHKEKWIISKVLI